MDQAKPKVLFLCARLGGGGAEKHLQRILNEADFSKYEVHLALTREGGGYEALLDSRIIVHHLTVGLNSALKATVFSFFPLLSLISRLMPDAIVSFMSKQNYLLSIISFFVRRCPPIIFCVQNAPKASMQSEGKLATLVTRLLPFIYNRADAIIAISRGVAKELLEDFRIKKPIEIIYNAGIDDAITHLRNLPIPLDLSVSNDYKVVACGRLTRQKGFDVLIRALSHLITIQSDYVLWILGDGPDLQNLEALAKDLGVYEKVKFLGFKDNPYSFFSAADCFVLSSRWEGFGNVITEAMLCEVPVISTKCPYGPDEIITDGVNGLLVAVESSESLSEAIRKLRGNPELANKLVAGGKYRSDDFKSSAISQSYFRYIETFLRRP